MFAPKTLGFGILALALVIVPSVQAAPGLGETVALNCVLYKPTPYVGPLGMVQYADQVLVCNVPDAMPHDRAVVRPAVHPDAPIVGCLVPYQTTVDFRGAPDMPSIQECTPSGLNLHLATQDTVRDIATGYQVHLVCVQNSPLTAICSQVN